MGEGRHQNTHQPEMIEGKQCYPTLYSLGGSLERQQAYQMIDEAEKGSYFYRIIIRTNRVKEDTHKDLYLREVVERMMFALEERLDIYISWVATTHNKPEYRYIYAVAIFPRRLDKEDLRAMRKAATENCLEQRQEIDRIREYRKHQGASEPAVSHVRFIDPDEILAKMRKSKPKMNRNKRYKADEQK